MASRQVDGAAWKGGKEGRRSSRSRAIPWIVIEVRGGVRIVFFFQAEDGIRDGRVTEVQTCALPISAALLFAVGAMTFFAVRDDIIRALHAHASPEAAAAATFVGGTLVSSLWARRAPSRGELRRLAPAGILFGCSYVTLFEAYFHGRVSVVSPLVATESLWAVALSAALLRHERVGLRLPLGTVLVV